MFLRAASTFRLSESSHHAVCFIQWADAWITVQLESQGRAFGGVTHKAVPRTYLSLLEAHVQCSRKQKTDWSDRPVTSLAGPCLHLNLPFNQLNQWKELIREGTRSMAARSISHTSRVTIAYGITLRENGIMWPFSSAIDSLIRTEAVWIQTSCLMWIIKGFQHALLPFDVFFSPLKRVPLYQNLPPPQKKPVISASC